MVVQYIIALLGGLALLAIAGDFLVTGATALARRMGVSPLVAGIIIVGFGTSAPEMVVALEAALSGHPELAFGNIVGSNIANIWLVLSVPALIAPIACGAYGQRQALVAMLIATAVWILVVGFHRLDATVGVFFLCALIGYAAYTFFYMRAAVARGDVDAEALDEGVDISKAKMLFYVAAGIIGLPLGANLIIHGGVGLATMFHVPEEVIGLTLLAVGTSLPEIGAGVAAVRQGRTEILFGNVLGSNIFNIFGAGGIVALFGPFEATATFLRYDHWAMGLAALTAAAFILTNSKVTRRASAIFLGFYAVYLYGLVHGWNITALFGG